jgi:gas vesicle protein
MSATRRLVRFGTGGLVGAGLGGAVALFLAPASGDGLRRRLRTRLARAKLAGFEAEAAKTSELVRKFRERVNDPTALSASEVSARLKVQEAADALRVAQAADSRAAPSGPDALPGSV